jgi:hypothetical protein
MKNKIILALAVMALVACGKKDSDKKTDSSQELVSKPELTQVQKDEIKDIISKSNVIPKADLLTDETATTDKKTALESKVKALPADEKQVYEKLKADCKVAKSERKDSGDLKAKDSKQESKTTSGINGEKCPIEFEHKSSTESTVSEGTSGEDGTVKTSSKSSETTTVKMQDLQTQSGIKEILISSTGAGTVVVKEGKLVSVDKTEKVSVKIVTSKDQKITGEMTFAVKDRKDSFDGYIRVDYEFPSSKPTIQAFRKAGEKETNYFLNGQKITIEKLTEIFTAKGIPSIGESSKESSAEIKRRLM